ncbi:protein STRICTOSIDINE SYNTHASE-LIKE 10-like [Rhodamnia argentea]|uniref:Protein STRICTOSIDINE SYNTHASE-LIKE 10-like n=1 Tax=Rhodamnia argentea TaxID=178133 RepID=A0A8B8QSH8_9MYRT|nr:protein STRICTOSIDINE SYNTHASE-LIKE 10-like [Rhodamnia argentea]
MSPLLKRTPLSLPLLIFSVLFVASLGLVSPFEMVSMGRVGSKYHQLALAEATGPESVAFDCRGRGPYVGVSDGRILKWEGPRRRWREFSVPTAHRDRKLCDGSKDPNKEQICGRPLGLKFNGATCDLYVADAYYGLLKVGPRGGVAEQLATSGGGVRFNLTNALDIDARTGAVYFTDSSIFYQRRNYMLSIENGDKTGRVLKYDPRTKRVTVLLNGLSFPNGLALSKDGSFLVVAETGNLQLLRIPLSPSGTGRHATPAQVFYPQLSRYPDNIKRNDKGEFWVALNSGRGLVFPKTEEGPHRGSSVRGRAHGDRDGNEIPWFTKDPVAIKFSEQGRVVEVLDGGFGRTFEAVSEVEEFAGTLWIGSVTMPYVGKFKAY